MLLYIAVSIWCISRFRYFKALGLNKRLIAAVFLIKVAVGLLYGSIHQFYFGGGDTFLYHEESLRIASTFFEYPSYYFQSILGFSPAVPEGADVYLYPKGIFIQKDLGTYVLVHIHAITQFFSFGSYQIHAIFVAFISLIASVNMYKIYSRILKRPSKWLVLLSFFLPSVLFWTSGFHKDLWVYLGLSWLMTGLLYLYEKQKLGKSIFVLCLGLLTVGLFRHYLLVLLFPAIVAYIWTIYSNNAYPVLRFTATYLALFIFVAIFSHAMDIDVLGILSARQHEFIAEKGGSTIMHLLPWEPNFIGFITFFPDAITNAVFRPFFWNCQDFLQYLAAAEITAFWVFAVWAIRFRKLRFNWHPLNYFLLTYAISNLILIGYLVTNLGTIVRYRSIAIGFLAIVLLQFIKQAQKTAKIDSKEEKQNSPKATLEKISD